MRRVAPNGFIHVCSIREIIPKIKSTSDKPIRFVAVTHYHADHTFVIEVGLNPFRVGIFVVAASDERGTHVRPSL